MESVRRHWLTLAMARMMVPRHRRRHWDEEMPATEEGVLWGLRVQRATKPQTILLSEPNRNNANVVKRFNSMLKL